MDILQMRASGKEAAKINDQSDSQPRLAGLDAVRAFATFGVVMLHSCVAYLMHPMPGLVWSVQDTADPVVDWLFWLIEVFIMPVFLVMAGYLAWQTLQRRGTLQLVTSRAGRLLKPLLFGMVLILPLDLYSWLLGWVAEGWIPPAKLSSLKVEGKLGEHLWGLSHLWFLQYLFLYIVLLAGWSVLRKRHSWLGAMRVSASKLMFLTVALGGIALWFHPEVVWGFQHAFLPVPSKWLYSGTFFAGGVLIASIDPRLASLQNLAGRLTLPAVMLTSAAVLLGRWHLGGGQNQLASFGLAILTVSGAWSVTLALMGWAAKSRSTLPLAVSYLAAASFWVYLVHHPLLGLVHLDLKLLLPSLHPIAKTVLAFSIASGVSLLTYETLVRTTRFGRWLGFAWSPDREQRPIEVSILRPPLQISRESVDRPDADDEQESVRRAA